MLIYTGKDLQSTPQESKCAVTKLNWGRDSVVGIVTRYGLDAPGIESRWGRDFSHPSRPALGPSQPTIQWVPGRGANHSPHLAPRLKKE